MVRRRKSSETWKVSRKQVIWNWESPRFKTLPWGQTFQLESDRVSSVSSTLPLSVYNKWAETRQTQGDQLEKHFSKYFDKIHFTYCPQYTHIWIHTHKLKQDVSFVWCTLTFSNLLHCFKRWNCITHSNLFHDPLSHNWQLENPGVRKLLWCWENRIIYGMREVDRRMWDDSRRIRDRREGPKGMRDNTQSFSLNCG